jgi:CRP-like cAMP-binding protein
MMERNEAAIVEAVLAGPLASELSSAQVRVLAQRLDLLSLDARDVLTQEGAVDERLFVVVDGALDIVRHRGTPDETLLATLRAGDLAHELGFLDGSPCYASLVTSGPTRVLALSRSGLEALIEAEPRVLYAVMRVIVRAVHRLQTRLSMQAAELTNYVVKQHGRY